MSADLPTRCGINHVFLLRASVAVKACATAAPILPSDVAWNSTICIACCCCNSGTCWAYRVARIDLQPCHRCEPSLTGVRNFAHLGRQRFCSHSANGLRQHLWVDVAILPRWDDDNMSTIITFPDHDGQCTCETLHILTLVDTT